DEPTNDLDVETLELLEELLLDYQGTLLLVSHDRDFLDHAVTSCLVFEGDGRVGDYVGGYSDWERMHKQALQKSAPAPAKLAKPAARAAKKASVKLSYKDQRELDELPARIEVLEASLEQIQTRMADPTFYQQGSDE
ncbi:ABC transporter ATPase, partial [Candidatus Endoriftia persephone str. Guaymas]|nr:ABC transporter ATPase [Candidatus Endoriftia persephone str. Guaymas]